MSEKYEAKARGCKWYVFRQDEKVCGPFDTKESAEGEINRIENFISNLIKTDNLLEENNHEKKCRNFL